MKNGVFFLKLLNKETQGKVVSDNEIVSPVEGEVFDIAVVPDPIFSEKKMGNGVAFRVKEKVTKFCSPCNGVILAFFLTGHAFGITMNNEVEILVHCGINTVQSNGRGI